MAEGNIVCFTEKRLETWAKGGSGGKPAVIYRDAEGGQKGLCFVVQQKRISFAFEGRVDGKSFRIVLGKYPEWPLGAARARAREMQHHLDNGRDPRLEKKRQQAANAAERQAILADEAARLYEVQRATVLTRDIWDEYLLAHQGEWGDRHYRDHLNLSQPGGKKKSRGAGLTVAGVLSPVLARPMACLDAEFLKGWLTEESRVRPNNARQGFEAFRAFWKWAAAHKEFGGLVTDPRLFEEEGLVKAKPKRRAAGARDVLEKSHLADWFAAVQGMRNREISAYLQVLLLSGARRNELLGLKWAHIETRTPANIWIHDKVEQEAGRYVPLGPYAQWLLDSLPKRKWVNDQGKERDVEWVFSGPDIGNARIHHDTPGAAHRRALGRVGLDVSLHGLRRSYASLSEWLEIPSGIVAQIQGHKASAVQERHYKRRPLELLAQWHCRFEEWILDQAGVDFKVEELRGGLRVVK